MCDELAQIYGHHIVKFCSIFQICEVTAEVKCTFTEKTMALWPTQLPIHWIPRVISMGLKGLGCEAGHSPSSSTEVKEVWSCTSTPPYFLMAWCLVKYRIHLHGMIFI
jgi:hypothetical protein